MSQVEQDRQAILEAKQKGGLATLLAYARLSGPGWLQGAITLGGGSLAGSAFGLGFAKMFFEGSLAVDKDSDWEPVAGQQ